MCNQSLPVYIPHLNILHECKGRLKKLNCAKEDLHLGTSEATPQNVNRCTMSVEATDLQVKPAFVSDCG